MHVIEHCEGDRRCLDRLVRRERSAVLRDKYRAVLLALEGGKAGEARSIAMTLDRSRRAVQTWVYLYRDGGIEALLPRPRGRRSPKLPTDQEQAFRRRFLAGPTVADAEHGGACTLRGNDAIRILRDEFGVKYTLPGVYCLLHRLGLSCLKPRPRHRKADPEQQARWLEEAPLLSAR